MVQDYILKVNYFTIKLIDYFHMYEKLKKKKRRGEKVKERERKMCKKKNMKSDLKKFFFLLDVCMYN